MSEFAAVFVLLCALRAEVIYQRELGDVRSYNLTTRSQALARDPNSGRPDYTRLAVKPDCECTTHNEPTNAQACKIARSKTSRGQRIHL